MSDSTSKVERIVGGFASLFSSALALNGENGVEPLKSSSDVLRKFISRGMAPDDVCTIIPSLALKNGMTPSSNGSSLEESAALNLAHPLALKTSELEAAPMALLANTCESLTTLIDSRLRSSIQALVRQSHTQNDPTLTRVLVGLLACAESPISPSTIVTSFRVLPACEVSANGDIVMPLVMETVVDLKIFGNLATVEVAAPGTIVTSLASDLLLSKAEIVLDTLSFLRSMMKQARFVVRKAVATASKIATNLLIPSSRPGSKETPCKVSSSHNLRQEPPVNEKLSSLMPPPPRRPSKRSFADVTKSASNTPASEQKNADWGTDCAASARERAIANGLSLLTAAAGLKNSGRERNEEEDQQPDSKKQRTNSLPPRKVTSCPRLEASI